jgi:SAM-dependent methyltransferase
MSKRPVLNRLYPEVGAGGFSRVDGTVEFYNRVNALLNQDMVVLDFGAGRGAQLLRSTSQYRRNLTTLKGKVSKVIGVDVDHAVLDNGFLDEAFVVEDGDSPLPIADASIDLIVSDWTFEHIHNPSFVAAELTRVLKPGGWLCARTPNRWGYVGIATNMVPNRLHARILKRLQPDSYRDERDVYPTTYQMNTMRTILRLFPRGHFENFSYTYDSEPAYFGNLALAWRIMRISFNIVPPSLRSYLFIFLRKALDHEN